MGTLTTTSIWMPSNRTQFTDYSTQVVQANSVQPTTGWASLARLYDELASNRVWWTFGAAGTAWLVLDLGSAKAVNSVWFINGNFQDAVFYFDIQAHTSNLGNPPWVGYSFAQQSDPFTAYSGRNDILMSLAQDRTYRYWAIGISRQTAGIVKLGELLIGVADDTPQHFQAPLEQQEEYRRLEAQTEGANSFCYALDRASVWKLKMNNLGRTEYNDLKDTLYEVRGGHPMAICVDDSHLDNDLEYQQTMFGRIGQVVPYTWGSGARWNAEMDLAELSRGLYATT